MLATYLLLLITAAVIAAFVALLYPNKKRPKGDDKYDPWDDWMGT